MYRYPDDASEIRTRLLAGDALVACLCTERCHKCDDWWGPFAMLANAFPSACFVWLDVDEHPDMVADIPGITAFPFLLVRTDLLRALGTVAPDHDTVKHLLTTHLDPLSGSGGSIAQIDPEPGLWSFLME